MPRCLITAGATRNPIDAIRYLSAHASGRTGASIAHHLHTQGLPVHLLGSAEAVLRLQDPFIPREEYDSTRDLLQRLRAHVAAHPSTGVVHSAAVGDYEAAPSADKIPSGRASLTLTLQPTPKILDALRGWGLTGPLVSFKAAAPGTSHEALVSIARAQLRRTGSDRVFANVIGRTRSDVFFVSETTAECFTSRSEGISALQDWLYARLA